jgi:hypothetical protein
VKVVITKVPQNSKIKAGAALDLTGQELDVLAEAGHEYITASEHAALQREEAVKAQQKQAFKGMVITAVNRAVEREAVLPKGDGENTVEKVTATAVKQLEQGADPEFVLAFIDGLPGKDQVQATNRVTRFQQDLNGVPFTTLEVTGVDIKDASQGYVKAMEAQDNLCRHNRWDEAIKCSKEAAVILKQHHLKANDLLITDAVRGATRFDPNTVKAATFSDPNSQVGALAGDLILMRNLGFLKYKLPWLGKLTTDFSGEPAKFGQGILTRYITPPGVLTWVPGVGFTSDAATIAAASAGTTQSGATTQASGTVTKSVPSTTDRTVVMNMFKATEIEFPVSLLGGTVRNLFAEQYSAQLYSLALEINRFVLGMLANPTAAQYSTGSAWGTGGVAGLTYSYTKALNAWNLTGMIGVKNKMSIAQIPDVGRFVLLHSFYHDKLLEDSNLLSAKAILALLNKDASSFDSGEVPTLFGVKPLESQIASWRTDTGALTTWVDDQNPGVTDAVGFAGNMSSGIFVSRPPQDWTTTLTQLGIPQTASVRLVTEPDSGMTVMVFSYADNGKMAISQRVCLMWGAAQGHPAQGFPILAA